MSQTVSHCGSRPAVSKTRPWVAHKWAATCPRRLNSCSELLDCIFLISHFVLNGSERGFVQRSFNQSASNPVSGIGDDYLSFFSSSLCQILSFICSSDYVSPHRYLLFYVLSHSFWFTYHIIIISYLFIITINSLLSPTCHFTQPPFHLSSLFCHRKQSYQSDDMGSTWFQSVNINMIISLHDGVWAFKSWQSLAQRLSTLK